MILEDRSLITAKLETEYGTDSVPTGGANAIEAVGVATHTIEAEKKERRAAMPYGGTLAPVNIATLQKLTFKVFLKGSGTRGTAPAIGPLLRACRLTETVTPATSVVYERHSSKTEESVTIYFYEDGILKKMTGCYGTVKADFTVNEEMTLDFEFTGLFVDAFMSDTALATPTYESTLPLIYNDANFVYGAITEFILSKFSWDLGHEVVKRPDANSDKGLYGFYTKNAVAPSGSFDPEMVAKAVFDPYTIAKNSTQADISTTVGSTAGNIVKVEFNNTVLAYPSEGSREGIKTYELNFSSHITNSAGNNEFALTFT